MNIKVMPWQHPLRTGYFRRSIPEFMSELIYSILQPVVVKLYVFCERQNVDRKSSGGTEAQ